MGQAESIPEKDIHKSRTHIPESNNLIPRASYDENHSYFKQIKDTLIDEWQNEEYPVWILIYHPDREFRIFFSKNDLESSIYNSEHAYIVKIPIKRPEQPVSAILEKISTTVGEFVDILINYDEPPVKMSNNLNEIREGELLKPIPKNLTKRRDYEFIHDQYFKGVKISLAIILDGKLIGVHDDKTRKFQWFIDNPNRTEIQYNLLMSELD